MFAYNTLSCSGKLPLVTEMFLQGKHQEEKVSETSANTAGDAKGASAEGKTGLHDYFQTKVCKNCLSDLLMLHYLVSEIQAEEIGTIMNS